MDWLRNAFKQNSILENAFAVFALCAGALIAFSLLFSMLKLSGLLSEVAAAWVQAVGSIAAIIGAARIASNQAAHELASRRNDMIERLESIAAMFEVATTKLAELHRQVTTLPYDNGRRAFPSIPTVNAARVTTMVIQDMSTRDTPTSAAAIALVSAQVACKNAEGIWPLHDGTFFETWIEELRKFHQAIEESKTSIRAEVVRLKLQ